MKIAQAMNQPRGFALPTVLISSVVMLIVLLAGLVAASSVNVSLRNQYYNKLAKEASESGTLRANECIRLNATGIAAWSDAKPLGPGTDCSGNFLAGCSATSCFLLDTPTVKSTYEVKAATALSTGGYTLPVSGKTVLYRISSPTVISQTITSTLTGRNTYIDPPQFGGGAGYLNAGHIGFLLGVNGLVYGFGDNSDHQINTSNTTAITQPVIVTMPPGVTKFKTLITSGEGASLYCGIGSDDKVYCRGKPGAGEIGLMNNLDGWQKFIIPTSPGSLIKSITLNGQGADNLCALTTTNLVYCAGDNYKYGGNYRLLGSSTTTVDGVDIANAVRFNPAGSPTFKKTYNQDRAVCAITIADDLYCQGKNDSGMLGMGTVTDYTAPQQYPLGALTAADVIASYHNWAAEVLHVLTDGRIYGSGENDNGELGNGTITIQKSPVKYGTRGDYTAMLSGPTHFCAISTGVAATGNVWCAGLDTYGQLGNGGGCYSGTPDGGVVQFDLPAGEVAASTLTTQSKNMTNATIILTVSGKIYSAGDNTYGRFGVGTPGANVAGAVVQPVSASCYPGAVKMQMPAGVTATSISTLDSYTTYFMGSDGKPYAVGRNNNGQLGDGTTTDRYTPVASKLPRTTLLY